MAEPAFDSNIFYRITNPSVGVNFSIDVANTAAPVAIGTVDITPSGPFMGQGWQLLNLESSVNSSSFLLSSFYLGAQKKLFVSIGEGATYVPFLTNFTDSPYDLSWIVSPFNASDNATTYSIKPTFLGGASSLSINTVTKQPFLEVTGGSDNQQWQFTPLQRINDASFSAAALSAVGTSTAAINSSSTALATSTSTATSSPTTISPSASTASSSTTSATFTPHGLVLAAIIAAPIILVVVLISLTLLILSHRRKSILKRNSSAIVEQKLRYTSQQTLIPPPTFHLSRPPTSNRNRSIYAGSMTSSSAYPQSSHLGFQPLHPSSRSWETFPRNDRAEEHGERSNRFFGGSALGDYHDIPRPSDPVSPTSPGNRSQGQGAPVTVPQPTYSPHPPIEDERENSGERRMDSPLSSVFSFHESEARGAGLSVSRTPRRNVSLISRWVL